MHRRGGYHPPACRAQAQVRGRLIAAPTGGHTFPRRDDHWSSVDPHPRPTNGASRAPPPTETGTRGRGHKPLPYGDGDKRAIRESPLRGDAGLHRRGGYHPPVCRAQAQVRGRLIAAPAGGHTFPRRDDHWSSVDPHPRPTNGASRTPPPTEGRGRAGGDTSPSPTETGTRRAIRESPLQGRERRGRLIAAPTKKRETGKLALPRLLNHNAKNQTNEFRIPVS